MSRIDDLQYMRRALSLARRGTGATSPNPMVGCVLVKDGEIVGEGYHRYCGAPHAEREALAVSGNRSSGSTAYVTLEPCSHQGKTPPCAPALVAAGISRCVIATVDPDPRVSGKGLKILEKAGISVETGILKEESRWLNRGFIKGILTGMPWVTLKAAVGLDGKLALANGESRWISNETSRMKAHLLRAESDAVMVGKGTVIKDDPALTVRNVAGHSPIPVVLGEVPLDRAVFFDQRCIIYPRHSDMENDLREILIDLHSRGVRRLLVEGGPSVLSSFLEAGLGDEISLFIAPKFMGNGSSMSSSFSIDSMKDSIGVQITSVRDQDGDRWIEGVFPCSLDLLRHLD